MEVHTLPKKKARLSFQPLTDEMRTRLSSAQGKRNRKHLLVKMSSPCYGSCYL